MSGCLSAEHPFKTVFLDKNVYFASNFDRHERKTWKGKCILTVQLEQTKSTGKIYVKRDSPSTHIPLPSATLATTVDSGRTVGVGHVGPDMCVHRVLIIAMMIGARERGWREGEWERKRGRGSLTDIPSPSLPICYPKRTHTQSSPERHPVHRLLSPVLSVENARWVCDRRSGRLRQCMCDGCLRRA